MLVFLCWKKNIFILAQSYLLVCKEAGVKSHLSVLGFLYRWGAAVALPEIKATREDPHLKQIFMCGLGLILMHGQEKIRETGMLQTRYMHLLLYLITLGMIMVYYCTHRFDVSPSIGKPLKKLLSILENIFEFIR